jgi:hypothetical protein
MRYFRGGTLVETLVSMTLIMIIMGASFTALSGIAQSTKNQARFRASFIVRKLLADENTGILQDTAQTDYGGFFIEQGFLPFDDSSALRVMVVNAVTPEGKVIFSGKRLVVSDDDLRPEIVSDVVITWK